MWAPLEALAAAGYKREQRLFSASLGEKGGQDTGIPSLRAAPGLQGCDSALPEGMEEMKWGEHQALCPAAPRVLWVSRSGSSPIAVPGSESLPASHGPRKGWGLKTPPEHHSWAQSKQPNHGLLTPLMPCPTHRLTQRMLLEQGSSQPQPRIHTRQNKIPRVI